MAWRIEYTNEPWLKKRRKKALKGEVARFIHRIEGLLQDRSEDGFMLGDSDFSVEALWVDRAQKHLLAVHDLSMGGGDWVASILFDEYPCMGVEEAKGLLRRLGLSETSVYGLNVTNEKTVGELLGKMEADLEKKTDEYVQQIRLINKAFLENLLEKGIIKTSDGLLDAHRKIHQYASGTKEATRLRTQHGEGSS